MTRWFRVSASLSTAATSFLHAPHRDAGPVGDHRGHRLGVYAGEDERGLTLACLEFGLQ